ncbi:MAG: argininosuccinate synthase domain-containing protein [Rikenellaceae bacterium]
MKKKVILAYSGGLDTSYCGVYLTKIMGYEVHAVLANTGGFTVEDIEQVEKRAYEIGCSSFTNLDVADDYYDLTIKYMVYGNMLKNGAYPISVSSERIIQAIAIAKYAKAEGADFLCHGSTGAGNDQIRFDSIFGIVAPEIEVIALIREQQLSREQEINFLKEHGIEMDFKKAEYSINKGLWGTSIGGKETLSSKLGLPEEAYPTKCTKSEAEAADMTITFEKGEIVAVDGKAMSGVEAICDIAQKAGEFAVGRGMHVGDTVIGIKGRVGFEAAAPMVIIKAHHMLEKHTLSKWQLFWKEQISTFYCNNLHEGLYFDPVMRDMEAMLSQSQEFVSGDVFVKLQPYRFEVIGIESKSDLMSDAFGSYGEMNRAFTGDDAKGFGKIFSLSSKIYNIINNIE